jgi:hypothetical protein
MTAETAGLDGGGGDEEHAAVLSESINLIDTVARESESVKWGRATPGVDRETTHYAW